MLLLAYQATLCAIALLVALVLPAAPSSAQTWPERSVRIIVPFAPGSSPDVAGRVFGEHLAKRWGRAVVVENRPGADGLTATTAFAAARDDHTLLLTGGAPISIYPFVHEKLQYDPARDVLPVSIMVETFGAIAVPASSPIQSLSGLVGTARSRPGTMNWSSGGTAFTILMAGFVKSAALEMIQVPYRDQNLALQDVAEGRIQVFVTAMTPILPLVRAGKIRVLAVTNQRRSPLWPDIPTVSQSGYPALGFEGVLGIFVPRDTSYDRRAQIAAQIQEIATDPTVIRRLGATGQIVRASTPAEFAGAIEDQRSTMSTMVRLVGQSPR